MVFSAYRLSNVTKEHINWAKQIRSKSFKREIFDKRGGFSRFFVDDEGNLCKRNLIFVMVTHIVVAGSLLFLSVVIV